MEPTEAAGAAPPASHAPEDDRFVVEHTRRWISSFVIGLGLCPFARGVFEAGRIRYAVSRARDEDALACDLAAELRLLAASAPARVETTLLIHPQVLGDFLDYNDFVGVVERILGKLRLRGTIQVATFHPRYRFAGTEPDAAENYTNRSPYPMLHLLRETSVSEAAAGGAGEGRKIPRRNIEVMRDLGGENIRRRLRGLAAGP